ncbi:unnamed protein product [Gadus morhua 'NCC']
MTTVIPPNPSLNPVNANASAAHRSLRQFPVLLAGGGRPLELVKGRKGEDRRPHGVPTASPRRPLNPPPTSAVVLVSGTLATGRVASVSVRDPAHRGGALYVTQSVR